MLAGDGKPLDLPILNDRELIQWVDYDFQKPSPRVFQGNAVRVSTGSLLSEWSQSWTQCEADFDGSPRKRFDGQN